MSRTVLIQTLLLIATVALPATAGALIDDDFETDAGAWMTTKGYERVQLGDGNWVFDEPLGDQNNSVNQTPLPPAIQIDLDLKVYTWYYTYYVGVYFHLHSPVNNVWSNKGYQLRWGYSHEDGDYLALYEKVDNFGALNLIASVDLARDNDVHHLRITDDGTGKIKIYWDQMAIPVLDVDVSGTYLVSSPAPDLYLGIGGYASTEAWFDNIIVTTDEAPEAVTDLTVVDQDWFRLDLNWTAPTDYPPGPAETYDVRYSTTPIDESNFDVATPAATPPQPASPGATESLTIDGLQADTTYYVALTSSDAGGQVSALSNVAIGTTGPLDVVAPDAVVDLSFADVRANRVELSWTTTGDDGSTGTADRYEVRYSTSPLTEANWDAAMPGGCALAPQGPGSVETYVQTGLLPETTYYLGVKVGDEVPNYSGLSNVVSFTTTPADLTAPTAVTDLRPTGAHINMVFLAWTAPSDAGGAGIGPYDVRYSTNPIDASNFDTATPATGEPAPAAPGATEHFTVTGLNADTTYYFGMKTSDLAEPANTSGLSNVVSRSTMPPVNPVTIQNPWIVNDRVADCRTLDTIVATFDKAYTPDGVIAPTSEEDRAINIYDNIKRRLYHWGIQPPDNRDTVEQMNLFGWTLCGSHAAIATTILNAANIHARVVSIPGHTIYEAEYGGKWHTFDTMMTFYVFNRQNPPNIACFSEISADKSLVYDAVAEGRACPGFLLCGDQPSLFAEGSDSMNVGSDPGGAPTDHSMDMVLHTGETLTRTWESWLGQHPPTPTEPPFHHEASRDWKDAVNYPYWEPYYLDSVDNSAIGVNYSATYRRWANGTFELQPDFTNDGYQDMLFSRSNVATFSEDGVTPHLHVASVGSPGEVVFRVNLPFYLTDAYVSGTFTRNDVGAVNKVYFSENGAGWTQVWNNSATGVTQLDQLPLRSYVYELREFYIKVELEAYADISDAGVSDLVIETVFEHNKGGMPYLDKGVNNITVTFDNPEVLSGGGSAFKVVYNWKEYDGADWTIDRTHEQYITTSPTTFTINVGGTTVSRTESIVMAVTEPPLPDENPPSAVDDLAVDPASIDSTWLDLVWTATGDDGTLGQATAYDLRYSTSPITDQNFDAATQIADVPAPLVSGSSERFTVIGLQPSTIYYFAIKVFDEGGNASEVSNNASATTNAPDVIAPTAITDLAAVAGTESGSVALSWTAPGDDGISGTAASYDIRYQPQTAGPISAANWAAATVVDGVPAPQMAGSDEQLTVTGLTLGGGYYFAIVASDEVPNSSGVSNSPLGVAAELGEITLQQGSDGYTGCTDNYMYMGNDTANYGSSTLLRTTGYADLGAAIQRSLVRFDLSSIPSGAPITRAMLWLYSDNPLQVKGSTGFYGAYKLTTDWGELTSSWSAPWTTPGGDFEAVPDAQSPKQSSAAAPCWYAFDVTSRVQAWINDPSDNYGWIIRCTDEMLHNQDEFVSSNASSQEYRPKLVITDLDTEDTVAPAAVTDMSGSDLGDSTIELTWTATGDDGATGTAWSYDLRYTTYAQGPITEANWDSVAQPVSGLPQPQAAGIAESFVVTGLTANQGYYFGLKVSDEVGNTSGLSNVADVWLQAGPRTVILEASKDGPMYGFVAGGNTNRGLGGRYDLKADGTDVVNGVLMQFDLAEVVGPSEHIESATLELTCIRQESGNVWNLDLRAYPILEYWVEGIGTTDGIVGSTAAPWGPATIGDAVYSYRQVTATAPEPSWGNYDSATDGVAWGRAGGRGIGADVADDLMVSQNVSGVGHVLGQPLGSLTFTPTGVTVLNQWALGTRVNHGLSLFPLTTGTGHFAAATREHENADWRTKLTLTIAPYLLGDIDDDGDVDIDDLAALVAALSGPNSATVNPASDLDGDGDCDMADYAILASVFSG